MQGQGYTHSVECKGLGSWLKAVEGCQSRSYRPIDIHVAKRGSKAIAGSMIYLTSLSRVLT